MKTTLLKPFGPSALALAVSSGLLITLTAGGQPQSQAPPGVWVPPGVSANAPAVAQGVPLLAAGELDKLVAPIALHPDPLLAQILPASTYPLEVVQASRWAQQHKGLKGPEVEAAVAGEQWAASVKALCPFPDVLEYMDAHLDWTTQLGDSVLNQEQDVLDAIQRMRLLAQAAGTLLSNDKQIVEVEDVGDRSLVAIRPYEPEVIYVPVYDPEVVYYRPRHDVPDDWAYGLFGFGAGVLAGSLFWDWDCDWQYRRIVYDHDGYRRSHHRVDWDNYDWDRYDWRRGDRIRQGGIDIDISYIDIDNIDINRYDWRQTDLRRFDWNRVDWRKVDYDRLDFGKRDWRDVDWASAGIRNPQLVEGLRSLPPGDRDQFRQRFDKARGNQQYKDRLNKLQQERRLGDKAPEFQAARWEHNPEHRRGVEYKGPAKEHFEKLVSEGGRPERLSGPRDGGGLGRGADKANRDRAMSDAIRDAERRPGDKESGSILKGLRDRGAGGGQDASSRRTQGGGDLKPSDQTPGGPNRAEARDAGRKPGYKPGDKEHSSSILEGLRDRGAGGGQDASSRRAQSGGDLKPSDQPPGGPKRAEARDADRKPGYKPGDKEHSSSILEGLRDRGAGGGQDASSRRTQGTGDLKPSDRAPAGISRAETRDPDRNPRNKDNPNPAIKALRDRELGGARLAPPSQSSQVQKDVPRSQQPTRETFRRNVDDQRPREIARAVENRQPPAPSNDRPKAASFEQRKPANDSGGQRGSGQQPTFERKSGGGGGEQQAKRNIARTERPAGGGDQHAQSNKGSPGGGGNQQAVKSPKSHGGGGDKAKSDKKDEEQKN